MLNKKLAYNLARLNSAAHPDNNSRPVAGQQIKSWDGIIHPLGDCEPLETANFFGAIISGAVEDVQSTNEHFVLRGARYLFLADDPHQIEDDPKCLGALCRTYGINSEAVARKIWKHELDDIQRQRVKNVLRKNGYWL